MNIQLRPPLAAAWPLEHHAQEAGAESCSGSWLKVYSAPMSRKLHQYLAGHTTLEPSLASTRSRRPGTRYTSNGPPTWDSDAFRSQLRDHHLLKGVLESSDIEKLAARRQWACEGISGAVRNGHLHAAGRLLRREDVVPTQLFGSRHLEEHRDHMALRSSVELKDQLPTGRHGVLRPAIALPAQAQQQPQENEICVLKSPTHLAKEPHMASHIDHTGLLVVLQALKPLLLRRL